MAVDRFAQSLGPWPAERLSDPAASAAVITPSDTVDLATVPKAIYIGVTGDVTVTLARDPDGTNVLFKAVPVGWLPVRPKRVWATGTTATNMVALD